MSRKVALGAVVLFAVLAGVIGWFAGRQIESPAEAAARVAPPPASLISVPVELQELSSAVVTRGTIEFDQTEVIEVTGSETGSSIITRLTKAEGDELVEGEVAVEVAGRPLLVLEGELPAFRSFTPGLEGPDVMQLEEALARLGLDPGPVDGVYGARTEDAVEELYRQAGYQPPAVDIAAQGTLDAAQDRVGVAETALAQAQRDAQPTGLSESERLSMDQSVASAQGNVDSLRAQRDAELRELISARDAAGAELSRAAAELTAARERHLSALDGVHPDTGAVPTTAETQALGAERQIAREAFEAAEGASSATAGQVSSAATIWEQQINDCLLYTSPSPRDRQKSRMPSSA